MEAPAFPSAPPLTPGLLQRLRSSTMSGYLRAYTWYTIFASLGGFLFGFDTGSIGPITIMPQFKHIFDPISPVLQGLIVSSILITASLSSLFAGPLSDRISRKYTIAIGAAVFSVGSVIAASSFTLTQIFIGRCITGAGEGLFLSTISVYTCEIAPSAVRGRLAGVTQLLITSGIAAGYFTCFGTVKLAGSVAWRFPLSMQAVIAAVFAAGSPFLPYSPRWLRHVGRHADAERAWAKLGVSPAEAEKEDTTQALQERAEARASNPWKEMRHLWSKSVRGRTLLACFLMAMNQASGIDGVLYYAPVLFSQAGLSSTESAFLASGVTGLLNIACTIPSQIFVDKWGRRPSMLWGGSVIAGSMLIIGILYGSKASDSQAGRWSVIAMIYVFVAAFSMSWAIVTRVYCSEIHPMRTRAAAMSIAQCANWVVNWIIAFSTPLFLARSSSGPYFLFGSCSMTTVLVCLAFQPETKGVSLEGLDDVFAYSPWRRLLRGPRTTPQPVRTGTDDIELSVLDSVRVDVN